MPLHAPWQRLAYLLNVEIHVPAFSSAPPAPRAAFVALLQNETNKKTQKKKQIKIKQKRRVLKEKR